MNSERPSPGKPAGNYEMSTGFGECQSEAGEMILAISLGEGDSCIPIARPTRRRVERPNRPAVVSTSRRADGGRYHYLP